MKIVHILKLVNRNGGAVLKRAEFDYEPSLKEARAWKASYIPEQGRDSELSLQYFTRKETK